MSEQIRVTTGQHTGQYASRRPRRHFRIGFAAGTCFGLALACLAQVIPAEAAKRSLDRQTFDRALTSVLDRHVDPTDEHRVLTTALKAAVANLDRHSSYVTRAERQATKTKGTTGFSGMFVHFDRPRPQVAATVEVAAIYPNTPAARAGLRPGDHILEINGQSTAYLSTHSDVERALAGRPGSVIRVVAQRPGQAANQVTFALAGADRATVTGKLHSEGPRTLGVITIHAFRPGTGEQFRSQLAALERKAGGHLDGVLLDLRNNPGGEVSEAVIVADTFLSKGLIVRTRGRHGRILREERARLDGTDSRTPVVILQNRFSASASELLAAALQDHKRARVVGERSFGKGTIQQVEGLPDGSLLTLTVARYYSPKDRRIDGRGVDPDVAVATAEAPGATDPWLVAGLKTLAKTP